MPEPGVTGRLAIGVLSLERADLTRRCIASVRETTRVPYHIYLLDNGSSSADVGALLLEMAEASDATVLRFETNQGPSAGRNEILRRLDSDITWIAFLDNDIQVLPGWDAAARDAVDAGYDIVQPKLLDSDGRTVHRGPTRPWPEPYLIHPEYVGRGLDRSAEIVSKREPVSIFGGTVILTRRVFDLIEPFDPIIWMAEDYDLALRAIAAGFRACYDPHCEMIHDHGYQPDYEKLRSNPLRSIESHNRIWEKHRKLILSPAQLWLAERVVRRGEAWFLPRRRTPSALWRRLRRRLEVEYANRRLGEYWHSEEAGARFTAQAQETLRRIRGGA